MYKHYIKTDENNNIIDAFSSWQKEKFDGTEILYRESSDRHFQLNLIDMESGLYLKSWDGSAIVDNDITSSKASIIAQKEALGELMQTDTEVSRVLEDWIDTLDANSVLLKSSMPQETQDKIANKKAKRQAYLDLLS